MEDIKIKYIIPKNNNKNYVIYYREKFNNIINLDNPFLNTYNLLTKLTRKPSNENLIPDYFLLLRDIGNWFISQLLNNTLLQQELYDNNFSIQSYVDLLNYIFNIIYNDYNYIVNFRRNLKIPKQRIPEQDLTTVDFYKYIISFFVIEKDEYVRYLILLEVKNDLKNEGSKLDLDKLNITDISGYLKQSLIVNDNLKKLIDEKLDKNSPEYLKIQKIINNKPFTSYKDYDELQKYLFSDFRIEDIEGRTDLDYNRILLDTSNIQNYVLDLDKIQLASNLFDNFNREEIFKLLVPIFVEKLNDENFFDTNIHDTRRPKEKRLLWIVVNEPESIDDIDLKYVLEITLLDYNLKTYYPKLEIGNKPFIKLNQLNNNWESKAPRKYKTSLKTSYSQTLNYDYLNPKNDIDGWKDFIAYTKQTAEYWKELEPSTEREINGKVEPFEWDYYITYYFDNGNTGKQIPQTIRLNSKSIVKFFNGVKRVNNGVSFIYAVVIDSLSRDHYELIMHKFSITRTINVGGCGNFKKSFVIALEDGFYNYSPKYDKNNNCAFTCLGIGMCNPYLQIDKIRKQLGMTKTEPVSLEHLKLISLCLGLNITVLLSDTEETFRFKGTDSSLPRDNLYLLLDNKNQHYSIKLNREQYHFLGNSEKCIYIGEDKKNDLGELYIDFDIETITYNDYIVNQHNRKENLNLNQSYISVQEKKLIPLTISWIEHDKEFYNMFRRKELKHNNRKNNIFTYYPIIKDDDDEEIKNRKKEEQKRIQDMVKVLVEQDIYQKNIEYSIMEQFLDRLLFLQSLGYKIILVSFNGSGFDNWFIMEVVNKRLKNLIKSFSHTDPAIEKYVRQVILRSVKTMVVKNKIYSMFYNNIKSWDIYLFIRSSLDSACDAYQTSPKKLKEGKLIIEKIQKLYEMGRLYNKTKSTLISDKSPLEELTFYNKIDVLSLTSLVANFRYQVLKTKEFNKHKLVLETSKKGEKPTYRVIEEKRDPLDYITLGQLVKDILRELMKKHKQQPLLTKNHFDFCKKAQTAGMSGILGENNESISYNFLTLLDFISAYPNVSISHNKDGTKNQIPYLDIDLGIFPSGEYMEIYDEKFTSLNEDETINGLYFDEIKCNKEYMNTIIINNEYYFNIDKKKLPNIEHKIDLDKCGIYLAYINQIGLRVPLIPLKTAMNENIESTTWSSQTTPFYGYITNIGIKYLRNVWNKEVIPLCGIQWDGTCNIFNDYMSNIYETKKELDLLKDKVNLLKKNIKDKIINENDLTDLDKENITFWENSGSILREFKKLILNIMTGITNQRLYDDDFFLKIDKDDTENIYVAKKKKLMKDKKGNFVKYYLPNKTTPIFNGNFIYEYTRIKIHYISEKYKSKYNDTDSCFIDYVDYLKMQQDEPLLLEDAKKRPESYCQHGLLKLEGVFEKCFFVETKFYFCLNNLLEFNKQLKENKEKSTIVNKCRFKCLDYHRFQYDNTYCNNIKCKGINHDKDCQYYIINLNIEKENTKLCFDTNKYTFKGVRNDTTYFTLLPKYEDVINSFEELDNFIEDIGKLIKIKMKQDFIKENEEKNIALSKEDIENYINKNCNNIGNEILNNIIDWECNGTTIKDFKMIQARFGKRKIFTITGLLEKDKKKNFYVYSYANRVVLQPNVKVPKEINIEPIHYTKEGKFDFGKNNNIVNYLNFMGLLS